MYNLKLYTIVNPDILGPHKQLQFSNTTTVMNTILEKPLPLVEIPFIYLR
jgi:hypothetical protein